MLLSIESLFFFIFSFLEFLFLFYGEMLLSRFRGMPSSFYFTLTPYLIYLLQLLRYYLPVTLFIFNASIMGIHFNIEDNVKFKCGGGF